MPDTPYSRGSIRRIQLLGVGSTLESSRIFNDLLLYTAYSLCWIRHIGLRSRVTLNIDQGFIYGVSDELDTAYSLKSGNGLEFV
ncbi:hypothetical protein Tco_1152200 [Tanacetum coccineum]